jgi:hypothetical protein
VNTKLTEVVRRASRLDAVVTAVEPTGTEIDGELEDLRASELGRFLLVERNVGSSGDPSHWFTTHHSLDHAGTYHVNQEYAHDWEIAFAVDLDTGERYEGELANVTWTKVSE